MTEDNLTVSGVPHVTLCKRNAKTSSGKVGSARVFQRSLCCVRIQTMPPTVGYELLAERGKTCFCQILPINVKCVFGSFHCRQSDFSTAKMT
mmetsp:Transcript_22424/g.52670  ORF Transcript_22424/g.52670 Transcript_22424/m.52670 type:complete len:92 (-) Transcript_22424:3-278(-)